MLLSTFLFGLWVLPTPTIEKMILLSLTAAGFRLVVFVLRARRQDTHGKNLCSRSPRYIAGAMHHQRGGVCDARRDMSFNDEGDSMRAFTLTLLAVAVTFGSGCTDDLPAVVGPDASAPHYLEPLGTNGYYQQPTWVADSRR